MPSLNSICVKLPIGNLSSPTELLPPSCVVPALYAMLTFTTGTTGVPKLIMREHRFLLCQSKSLSLFYEIAVKREIELDESEAVICTNLAVFPLHFLTVGFLLLIGGGGDGGGGGGGVWVGGWVCFMEQ